MDLINQYIDLGDDFPTERPALIRRNAEVLYFEEVSDDDELPSLVDDDELPPLVDDEEPVDALSSLVNFIELQERVEKIIEAFPKLCFDVKKIDEDLTCSICFEDIKEEDEDTIMEKGVQTHCFHVFHQQCLEHWFEHCLIEKKDVTCPKCRMILKDK